MKKSLNLILIVILLFPFVLLPQSNYNKVGGVGFRIDDSQYYPDQRLQPLVDVFNARGLKFTYCVNFGIYISQALLDYLPQMQLQGFEIADHTPDHQTRFFDVPLSDLSFYQDINTTYPDGIDHIYKYYNNNFAVSDTVARICLKVDHVRTDNYNNYPVQEGLISINGKTVTSQNPNEFTNMKLSSTQDGYSMNVIYIPSAPTSSKLFKFEAYNVSNNTITNLKSFWDEDNVDLNLTNVPYHKMWLYDVYYTTNALRVMAARTQQVCDDNGITRPTAWIQPGGYHPQFYKADIKDALESMGYISAGVFADPVPPYYNSYDPNDDKRFGINWEDFNEETQTLAQSKKIIADRFAKHYVSIGHSHLLSLNDPPATVAQFNAYKQRTADILDWCVAKGIPVKTYHEWAEQIYETPQNPYVNVMPKLENDLNEDGIPDAFTIFSGSTLDKNDGPNQDFPYSVSTNNDNYFCQVTGLGGIEKGENYFGIWIKGFPGNIVGVNIKLNYEGGNSTDDWYFLNAYNTDWQKYDLTQAYNMNNVPLNIPDDVNTIDVTIKQAGDQGVSKIGGFELRKNYAGQIIPPFLNQPNFNISTNSVPLVWEDNSSNETSFRVRRMFEKEKIWKEIKNNLPANSTNWVDNLLDFPDALRSYDSITVFYEIRAYVGNNTFISSNIDSIRIKTEEALPVELSSFKAKYNNNKVQLSWRTETEVNNYGFDIERKVSIGQSQVDNSNGKGWEKIGFVNGNGNSNTPKEYSYLDINPIGESKIQYRLKQIDNDGKYEYSDAVEVEIVPTEFALYQNYPNPFNPATKIRYQLPEKSRVYLKVFNSLGQEVAKLLDDTKEPGNYEVDFIGSDLSSGVYYYRMQAGDFISTKKMIILK